MRATTPAAIAIAVANNPHFIKTIRRGLDKKPPPDSEGPRHAQIIADKLRKALAAD